MNKLLWLIIIGIVYILLKCNNIENMAELKPTIVSASKINFADESIIPIPQYIEFINGNDKYIMIDYRELSKEQIRNIIQAVKTNNLTTFENNMCLNQSDDIDTCIDYILKTNTKHIPLFLMNKNDITSDTKNTILGKVLGFNVVYNIKKNQDTRYNSLIAYNVPKSEVDFTNNTIKNINSNEIGVVYLDKNNNMIINTESRKEIKDIDMNNLTLNQIIPKIFYLSN
jgi:hypothetical protein